MTDVEGEVVAWLRSCGLPARADVPRDRPEELVTVERTGGGAAEGGALDAPMVVLRSWAPTRARASELARRADAAMLALPDGTDWASSCERNAIYNYPDGSSPRYQAVYDLVCY